MMGQCPHRRKKGRETSLHVHVLRKGHVSTSEEGVRLQARRGAFARNQIQLLLGLGFPASRKVGNKHLLFNLSSL